MLAIRMQRTGRKGYATFRIIVQDSKFSPTSGRVVANVGHYNPHTKEKSIDVEAISKHLENGAQPSERVVRLLKAEKMKLPKWVAEPDNSKNGKIKNQDKLRKNQPEEPAEAPAAEAASEETPPAEEPAKDAATEAPAEEVAEAPAAEEPKEEEASVPEEKAEEKSAETESTEEAESAPEAEENSEDK